MAYQQDHRAPGRVSAAEVDTIERLRDGPVLEMYAADQRVRRWDLVATARPRFLRWGGDRHQPRLRLALERSHVAWGLVPGASSGPTAERVGPAPARLWDIETSAARLSGRVTRLSLGFEDRIAIARRALIVEPGLELARSSGFRETSPARIEWKTFSARLGARWRPVSFASVYGGWERFHPRLPARHLLWGDPGAPLARVHRWNDDGDGAFEAAERGPLVALSGPSGRIAALDPELRSPHTQGIVAGIDLGPVAGWRIRFAGVKRTARDLVESIQTGLSGADYTTTRLPDPYVDLVGPADDRELSVFARRPASFGRDRYLLTNVADHDVAHENVEVFLEGRPSGFFFRLGGTASRITGSGANPGYGVLENDPGIVGELFDHPQADSYARGRFFFDRAYTLKLASLWRPPGWSLGLVAQYQDGQPFARVVLVRDLPQGAEVVPAFPRADHRFTYTLTIDARVERELVLGDRRLAVAVEVFNVPDMRNEVEEDIIHGPSFRTVTAVQPPRAIRLGLRLDF